MAPRKLLLLECLLCRDKYDDVAVQNGTFFLETMICKSCYKLGQKESPQVWCFAKLQSRGKPGYSSKNVECQMLCPDRKICRRFLKIKE